MASCGGPIERDRAALEALFDATGGADWKDNSGWKNDPDLAGWCGVAVSEEGSVKSLKLVYNKLRGMRSALLMTAYLFLVRYMCPCCGMRFSLVG